MKQLIYETKDLYIAAYLIAIGHSLKSHSRYDGEIYFVFDNNENIQQEVNKFISRKALVDPVAYSQIYEIAEERTIRYKIWKWK